MSRLFSRLEFSGLSDEAVEMLREGSWKNPAKIYVPPRRRHLIEKT
ncbi:MAG: hypothetical protein PHH93_01875 [Prolixibacteraceae bacterium]|nr:hypothetical protein [Prolixibacteraceae bacterium]